MHQNDTPLDAIKKYCAKEHRAKGRTHTMEFLLEVIDTDQPATQDSTSKSITAQATVTLTLSVKLGSIWGEDCTVGQLTRQATTEAKRMVTEKIGESREHSDRRNATRDRHL